MDSITKAVGAFIVFCVGVAILILASSWAFRPTVADPCKPLQYPLVAPSYCPKCGHCLTEPYRPDGTFPTPNRPRPGSQTGNLGDKGAKETK